MFGLSILRHSICSVFASNRLSDHKNHPICRLFEGIIRVVIAGSLRESAANGLSERRLPLLAAILSTSKRAYTPALSLIAALRLSQAANFTSICNRGKEYIDNGYCSGNRIG